MRVIGKTILVSLACHAVLVLAVLCVHVRAPDAEPAGARVYEVELAGSSPRGMEGAPQNQRPELAGKRMKSRAPSLETVPADRDAPADDPLPGPPGPGRETPDANGSPGRVYDRVLVMVQGPLGSLQVREGQGGLHAEIARWKSRMVGAMGISGESAAPAGDAGTPAKATFLLRVSRQGELLQEDLLESSGDESFDRSVRMTLSGVTRLPPPPLFLIAGSAWLDVKVSFIGSGS